MTIMSECRRAARLALSAATSLFVLCGIAGAPASAQQSNACPVDGCEVSITSATTEGTEVALVLDANFAPDLSRNHIHVWWGENYSVAQVSNNAEPVHGVQQGEWHPTDAYPDYVTTGASSTSNRGEATTLCVSAADRNHDILDVEKFQCVSVEDVLSPM